MLELLSIELHERSVLPFSDSKLPIFPSHFLLKSAFTGDPYQVWRDSANFVGCDQSYVIRESSWERARSKLRAGNAV